MMYGERTKGLAAVITHKECVAVLIGLYKKNGAVSCVGFDFVLYTKEPTEVVTMLEYPDRSYYVMGSYR